MATVDQRLVLERARAMAEEDGFAWRLDSPGHRHMRPLSEARRELYVQRAREELSNQSPPAGPAARTPDTNP